MSDKDKIIAKKDEVIEALLQRLNRDKEKPRDQYEVVYCAYCPEWEINFKEDSPFDTLNVCSSCWEFACDQCAQKNGWCWIEEIKGIKGPPYYTDYFCPECAENLKT